VRYREVVILCDLHELSYADVAAILRISIGGVRSRCIARVSCCDSG
jgi:DNA-directed RNA polymerase specialized sigma24 family protein